MSKNNTTIQITKLGNKTSKNNSASGKKKNKNQTSANEQPNRQETFHFLAGSILLVISLLMLLSFSSHIFTGAEDQGLIEAHAHEGFANYAGSIGAYCADFWMNQCFGFAAFFIPIFLLAASMKLTKAYHIRLWKWFLHCAFLTFWVSISSSYFLDNLISRRSSRPIHRGAPDSISGLIRSIPHYPAQRSGVFHLSEQNNDYFRT